MAYYYDFLQERSLTQWKLIGQRNGHFLAECLFLAEEGDWLLCWRISSYTAEYDMVIYAVNGRPADRYEQGYYYGRNYVRGVQKVHYQGGLQRVVCEVAWPSRMGLSNLSMQLLPASVMPGRRGSPSVPFHQEIPFSPYDIPQCPAPQMDVGDWQCGVGWEKAAGRFGFCKGDGLLDCAMSCFGKVDKMYLAGNPRWKHPYTWGYSLMQEDEEQNAPDELEVSAMGVCWKRRNTLFRYSIASPAIVTENRTCSGIRISHLEYAGGYRYILTAGEVSSLDCFSGVFPENWFLLFGAMDFPDIPLLVLLEEPPRRMDFQRLPTGVLTALHLEGCHRIMTMTPFGMDMPEQPHLPEDAAFLESARSQCRFWSHATLAFPIACREKFRLDREKRRVEISQEFSYRFYADAWGTQPLELAPLPPVLGISGQPVPEGAMDFHFPTKYGPLQGYTGKTSCYSLGMMTEFRRYPLRDSRDFPECAALLAEDLQEHLEYARQFPLDWQSYAYPGAILEGYAFECPGMLFYPREAQAEIREQLSRRIPLVCNPHRRFTLRKVSHDIMHLSLTREDVSRYFLSPDMASMTMCNCVERREPFTGCTYNICYYNCGLFTNRHLTQGSVEEIQKYPYPLIENDWGIGLTLYMLYSAVLATGELDAVRKNWDTLKGFFRFFWVYHDWACMAAGYAEKSRRWVEGASTGAFPAMIHLAQMVGDTETADRTTYLAAKHAAIFSAQFLGGRYFASLYHVASWNGLYGFWEEYNPGCGFQSVPERLSPERCIPSGVSILTTDGVYPELFEYFREVIPEATRSVRNCFRTAFENGMKSCDRDFAFLLMSDALDDTVPEEDVRRNLKLAWDTDRFLKQWHDLPRFENDLPIHAFHVQLLGWLSMRHHFLWLEYWQGIRILDGKWNREKRQAVIEFEKADAGAPVLLRCGIRRTPKCIRLNGDAIAPSEISPRFLVLRGMECPHGILEFEFEA